MRYPKEHKAISRARILESARRQFRKQGFEGASIDQVMAGAELTRGAFYAHFPSKEALESAVLGIRSGLETELEEAAQAEDRSQAAATVLKRYLEPAQRVDVTEGCPLVTHPVDALRGSSTRRQQYATHVSGIVAQLDRTLGTSAGDMPSERAIRIAVLAVGGALLSGASGEDALADRIASTCARAIEREYDAA